MDAVYPAPASALARGRRGRGKDRRQRTRTQPVTFAEIKEVDEGEDPEGAGKGAADERRRRPDVLDEPLGPQLAEFRRRRTRRDIIREPPDEQAADSAPAQVADRAGSEPRARPAAPAVTQLHYAGPT